MKKVLIMVLVLSMLLSGCGTSRQVTTTSDYGDVQGKNTAVKGESLEYDGIKITLDSVENYVDTTEYPMDIPDEGKEYVVLRFTAENTGDEDVYLNMFNAESYCDDVAISSDDFLINLEGEAIWGDIAPGKLRKGYVAYEAEADWSKIEFIYSPDILNDKVKMIFTAQKSDIE